MHTMKVRNSYAANQQKAEKMIGIKMHRDPVLKDLWSVIGNTPEALMLLDKNYNIVLYNKKAASVMRKFTGNNIAINENLISILPEFRKEDVANKLCQVTEGNSIDYEVEYQRNNWLRVSLIPIKGPDGTVHEIGLTIRDVTGYKSIEKKLKARAQEYHSLLDSLSEGVVYQTLDKKIVKCNKSGERILQIQEEKLQQTGFPFPGWKLFDQKNEELDFSTFLIPEKKGCRPVRKFIVGIKRDAYMQWLSMNIEPVKDKNDIVKACVFTFIDITQQEKVNKDLKILLLAATKVNNSVVVTDSKRKIVWANDAFTRNTGYSFEEVEGKVPGHFLQGKETDQQTVKYMREQLRKQLPFECEIQNYRKNGEIFWMRLNVQPLFNDDNSLSGYLGVGTDITEQKKLQEKLIQQRVEVQKEITRATIAGQEKERNELGRELHDNINQILAATKIQLECYIKSEKGKPECIAASLEYLKLAISEIRNLSRHLVAPRFHDNQLIDEISLVIEHLGLKEKTSIEAANFDIKNVADEVKLTLFRIIQEQLNNIIKYAKAQFILLKLETNDQGVTLFISDDGVGFDTSQKRDGIGLNNIHNRVELLGGSAQIISAPGKGCQLQISIPLNKP